MYHPMNLMPSNFHYWRNLNRREDLHNSEYIVEENGRLLPSWPARTSSNEPVCSDQTKILNGSNDPAQTTEPVDSTAKEVNWHGFGEVMVRKFRYLIKSWALTVPSREDDKMTRPAPWPANFTPVTGAVWALKVIKQNPVEEFHSFTSKGWDNHNYLNPILIPLASSPPVAIYCPSFEKSIEFKPYRCPCCFNTYDSDFHSHTRSCPSLVDPNPIHSPVALIQAVLMNVFEIERRCRLNFSWILRYWWR